jgi:hypothetical protein
MGLGLQFVARLGGPSASPLAKSVAVTVGIVLPVAAFAWFVSIAPAVVSFAVAVGAAVVWCAWLEKHPEAPAHVADSTHEALTDATRAMVSVNVLATTHDGTRCALAVAKRLIGGLDAQVVLLLPRLASLAALEGLFRHFLVPLQARMPIVEVRRSERHEHERGQRQSGSYTDGRFEGR